MIICPCRHFYLLNRPVKTNLLWLVTRRIRPTELWYSTDHGWVIIAFSVCEFRNSRNGLPGNSAKSHCW